MSRKLSLRSLFGTLAFIMLTAMSAIIIYMTKLTPNQPVFWGIGVFFIGMFLCMITCLSNINYSIKIKNKYLRNKDIDVMINTCPEYWIKRVVKDRENNENITMCYNKDPNKNLYYNGTLKNVNDQLINENLNTSNLENLRNLALYSNVEEFVEYYPNDSNNYAANLHQHHNLYLITREGTSNVESMGGNSYSNAHTHYIQMGVGYHSHDQGGLAGEITGTYGQVNLNEYVPTHSNFDYWINPSPSDEGMEINLKKLNEAKNTCELGKMFAWVEPHAKCT